MLPTNDYTQDGRFADEECEALSGYSGGKYAKRCSRVASGRAWPFVVAGVLGGALLAGCASAQPAALVPPSRPSPVADPDPLPPAPAEPVTLAYRDVALEALRSAPIAARPAAVCGRNAPSCAVLQQSVVFSGNMPPGVPLQIALGAAERPRVLLRVTRAPNVFALGADGAWAPIARDGVFDLARGVDVSVVTEDRVFDVAEGTLSNERILPREYRPRVRVGRDFHERFFLSTSGHGASFAREESGALARFRVGDYAYVAVSPNGEPTYISTNDAHRVRLLSPRGERESVTLEDSIRDLVAIADDDGSVALLVTHHPMQPLVLVSIAPDGASLSRVTLAGDTPQEGCTRVPSCESREALVHVVLGVFGASAPSVLFARNWFSNTWLCERVPGEREPRCRNGGVHARAELVMRDASGRENVVLRHDHAIDSGAAVVDAQGVIHAVLTKRVPARGPFAQDVVYATLGIARTM